MTLLPCAGVKRMYDFDNKTITHGKETPLMELGPDTPVHTTRLYCTSPLTATNGEAN